MTGIICLDKPSGITSFGAVARMRRIANEKKIGHCGTLDPMATGVLPLMLGGTTRFLDFIPDHDKTYTAQFKLGIETDTLDITGTVLKTAPVTVGREEVEASLCGFRGEIMQVPPMYSACSQGGVRLYELARKGIEVERPARAVTIYKLELLQTKTEPDVYEIKVECSKGTYIRTLVQDIGRKLGCGAVMTALRRTKAAGFSVSQCVTLEQAQAASDEGRLEELLIPLDRALEIYPSVYVSPAQAKRFSNGGELMLDRVKLPASSQPLFRVYCSQNGFIGLGEADKENASLNVKRVFTGGADKCR